MVANFVYWSLPLESSTDVDIRLTVTIRFLNQGPKMESACLLVVMSLANYIPLNIGSDQQEIIGFYNVYQCRTLNWFWWFLIYSSNCVCQTCLHKTQRWRSDPYSKKMRQKPLVFRKIKYFINKKKVNVYFSKRLYMKQAIAPIFLHDQIYSEWRNYEYLNEHHVKSTIHT